MSATTLQWTTIRFNECTGQDGGHEYREWCWDLSFVNTEVCYPQWVRVVSMAQCNSMLQCAIETTLHCTVDAELLSYLSWQQCWFPAVWQWLGRMVAFEQGPVHPASDHQAKEIFERCHQSNIGYHFHVGELPWKLTALYCIDVVMPFIIHITRQLQ